VTVPIHMINGKPTKTKDIVHYTDASGMKHAAKIEHIDGNDANLHIFHAHGAAANASLTSVPHSPTGIPHSWNHLED
jgi:hypothetical protein